MKILEKKSANEKVEAYLIFNLIISIAEPQKGSPVAA